MATDGVRQALGITRMAVFGSRDLLLGTALLAADDRLLVPTAKLGAAIDALDAIATGIEYRAGRVSGYSAVSVGCGAALFVVLGLLVIRAAEEPAGAESSL